MPKSPDSAPMYKELVELLVNNPNTPITGAFLEQHLGARIVKHCPPGSINGAYDHNEALSILGRMHDALMARLDAMKSKTGRGDNGRTHVGRALSAFESHGGVMYRTGHGAYVFDTGARISRSRGRIERNAFPIRVSKSRDSVIAPWTERKRRSVAAPADPPVTETLFDAPTLDDDIDDTPDTSPGLDGSFYVKVLGHDGVDWVFEHEGRIIASTEVANVPTGTPPPMRLVDDTEHDDDESATG